MKLKKKDIDKLKRILNTRKYVKFAYLFGSAAKGKMGPLSDVDIAVFLDEKLNKKKMFDKELELINEISGIFKTFDLVVLNNEATRQLRYNIIRDGKLLKTSKNRAVFEFRTMDDYLDNDYYEHLRTEISLKRFSERGFK